MPTLFATEARRLTEQSRLDELKDSDERNRWGQFATPPQLSLDIARHAFHLWSRAGDGPVSFLDPAIGTGSFFSALRHAFPDKLIEHAAGIELDPRFAEMARSLWAASGLNVTQSDFTTCTPQRQFNLILTNPPYVRHHHLDVATKERLKARVAQELGLNVSGLAGLYCYFLLLADRWLAEGGLSIWLIPSEFMAVNYGTAIKQYLKERVTLLHIHRFCPADVQFSDALVSSAIVVFRKALPPSGHEVQFSFGGSLTEPSTTGSVLANKLRVEGRWTKYPESAVCDFDEERLKLGDVFTIKRGLATGDNKFFIIPKSQAARLGVPGEFCRPILPSPRYLQISVVEARPDGYPSLEEPLCLIDCGLPEEQVRDLHPRLWQYLEEGKRRRIDEGYLASHRSPWYSQEQRGPAPFVCTYMGRTSVAKGDKPFRFIWNKSQATAANVYLMLYPKGILRERLANNPQLHGDVFDTLCRITGEMFVSESRVYGGGLHKLEPKELARVSAEPILAAVQGIQVSPQKKLF